VIGHDIILDNKDNQMIKIYRCDDSDAFGLRTITVNIDTSLSLAGATAKFSLVGFTQLFTTEQLNTKTLSIVIPYASAKLLPLGLQYGSLTFYDIDGRVLTIFNRMAFLITNIAGDDANCEYDASITINSTTIAINMTVGSAAGTIDYNTLANLPTLNGTKIKDALVLFGGIVPQVTDLPVSVDIDGTYYLVGTSSPYSMFVWDGTKWVQAGATSKDFSTIDALLPDYASTYDIASKVNEILAVLKG